MFKTYAKSKFYPLITMVIGLVSFWIGYAISSFIHHNMGGMLSAPLAALFGCILLKYFLGIDKNLLKVVLVGFLGMFFSFYIVFTLMFALFSFTGNWGNFLYVLFINVAFGIIFAAFIYGKKSIRLFAAVCGIVAIPFGLINMYLVFNIQIDLSIILKICDPAMISMGTGLGISIGLIDKVKSNDKVLN